MHAHGTFRTQIVPLLVSIVYLAPLFYAPARRPIAVLKEIDIRWQAASSSENENLQCS